jgi:hypothetical protein
MKKPKSKDEEAAYGKDEPQVVMTPEKSFKDSAQHSLNGTKLEPYTVERMWAADSMGLRWGRLSSPAAKQFATDNTYPGMSGDVAIVMWLCSVTDVEEIRCARRDPSPAEEKAIAFAEKHKIASPKQKEFWLAYKVFLDMMTEVHVAYAEPEKKTEKEATTVK